MLKRLHVIQPRITSDLQTCRVQSTSVQLLLTDSRLSAEFVLLSDFSLFIFIPASSTMNNIFHRLQYEV